jgi:hypothetical protein
MDELKTEFYVCKHNMELLTGNGPFFHLKFLKGLVTAAKKRGDSFRASTITGIIQREASRKQWKQINKSTHKNHTSLSVGQIQRN